MTTAPFNTCAFCGTDVKQGFEICPGCGATYRRPAEARFRALCIGAFGVAIFLLALAEGRSEVLIGGSVLAPLFVFIGVVEYRRAAEGVWRRVRSGR